MADYSWAYEDYDERARFIRAENRLKELKEGYVRSHSQQLTSCIRCGCVVMDRNIHDGVCPWTEEMFQGALERLGDF